MSDPRETAIKLVAQAVDPGVTKEEARSFAHKAILFIHQHKLLDAPEVSLKEKVVSFWKAAPIERVVQGINTAGFAAAGYEVIRLKEENERLNERVRVLKRKLQRARMR